MAQVEVKAHGEVAGYFVLSTDKRGEIARFPNLITNGGLDRMGTGSDWLRYCQVGSGSAAPAFTDSSMGSLVAATGTVQTNVAGTQSASPYFTWRRNTYRFSQGAAAGNLSEVGVGWATAGGLFSRALILDSGGLPATITIQADETLDVTYEFRYYPKTTDDTGQIVLSGNIGGTYDWVFRASEVTAIGNSGWEIGLYGTSMNAPAGSSGAFREGGIAAITGQPSGSSGSVTLSASGYSAGSHEIAFTMASGLADSNFATGIGAAFVSIGIPAFQVGFTPKIPKTANDTLSLVFKHSWARRP